MPIFSALPEEIEWTDPDDVPRPVVALGFAVADVGRIELDLHRHRKSQILLVQSGALSCEIEGGLWIVPPRSALWIPGGALHAVRVTGGLEGYGAFIDPEVDARLPTLCCAVSVTPLLRELLVRSAHLPLLYEESGTNTRLISVLLDELAAAGVEDLHFADADRSPAPPDRGSDDGGTRRAGDGWTAGPSAPA